MPMAAGEGADLSHRDAMWSFDDWGGTTPLLMPRTAIHLFGSQNLN